MSLPVFHNFKIKVIVFIFAVFMWFFVITENDYEAVIEVPVVTVNLPENKVVLNDLPKTVKVRVKGSGKDLIALSVGQGARVDLDMSNVEKKKVFVLEPRNVFLSRPVTGLTTKEIIMPDSIFVEVDDLVSKSVAVLADVAVEVAPGFTKVGSLKVMPDSVVVMGPNSIVSNIENVSTSKETFTDLRFDLKQIVPLAAPPSNKVEISVSQVEITLNVQELVELTISGVPVQVRNAPQNLDVQARPTTLSLVVAGGGELLTKISRSDIVAYIDYSRVHDQLGQEHAARIIPPAGVSVHDVQPRKFKLVVEKKSE